MTKTVPKSKFKCRSCDISFLNKKNYEKHRKTQEHKEREIEEKKMQYKRQGAQLGELFLSDGQFEKQLSEIYGVCTECSLKFYTREKLLSHTKNVHKGIDYYELDEEVQKRSQKVWIDNAIEVGYKDGP